MSGRENQASRRVPPEINLLSCVLGGCGLFAKGFFLCGLGLFFSFLEYFSLANFSFVRNWSFSNKRDKNGFCFWVVLLAEVMSAEN